MILMPSQKWIRLACFNLIIVAILGVVMRYKIGFEFPHFDQKHLQLAHSHFAFFGWVSFTLMVLIVNFMNRFVSPDAIKTYNRIIIANLVCSYGMLIAFAINGYDAISISFSTGAVMVAYVLCAVYFADIKKLGIYHPSVKWFKAALIFNIISSLGTFALAYMMATKKIPQHSYLGSVYWYLHFQYNGWFFYSCVALFIIYVQSHLPEFSISRTTYRLFAWTCIPAYGLSVLWLKLPWYLYIIVVAGTIGQSIGWIKFLSEVKASRFMITFITDPLTKWLLYAVALALSIKFLLQLGSTIPAVSKMAFGFRPIVIAYLHLILLAVISLYLAAHLYGNNYLVRNATTRAGLFLFVLGILFNELILAVQGVASLDYIVVPLVDESLLLTSLVLFSGILILFIAQFLNPSKKYLAN